jgi:hypothetical protein
VCLEDQECQVEDLSCLLFYLSNDPFLQMQTRQNLKLLQNLKKILVPF